MQGVHHEPKTPSITNDVLLPLRNQVSKFVCGFAELDLDVQPLKILLASPA